MAEAVGASVLRKEDPRLLRGHGRFGSDLQRPRTLHARVVRSSVASGRIVSIETEEARVAPGVVAVVTSADLPDDPRIPVRISVRDIDLTEHLQPVLARDTVRYVGEPLAVVVAEDAYAAEDAAEQVVVDIEPDEVLLTSVDADPSRIAADFTVGYGDVAGAFRGAAHVVALDFHVGRHTAVPMEPRSLVVEPGADGSLDIHGATKVPVFNRQVLADLLGMDTFDIRMRACDAGGGFGVRGEFYPEDFLVPWLALRLRRTISWTEDRAEHLVAVNHSREQHHRVELALDPDGAILGLRDDVWHDNGGYIRTHGVIVPELTLSMLPGPYRVPAYEGRVRVVLTNKTPCGTYRAPGRFEGTTVREQLLDKAAIELGLDRVELRRRNLLTPEELPHTRPITALGTDMVLDNGDYAGLMDRALTRAEELGWRARVEEQSGEGLLLGLGVANFLEKSGLGPHDTADVEITRAGRVKVHSGGTSLGQGIETALAQIVADELGVGVEAVDVVNGDTELQPYGTGSWASRSTVMAGNAVRGAGQLVAQRVLTLASRTLEVAPEDLELADAGVRVRGVPHRSLTLAEVWQAAQPGGGVLQTDEPAGLWARHRFHTDHMTYPYGTHVCLVEVDPATGGVRVLGYLVAYEIGRAVNPMLVEGQLRGGVAQGIGGALLEQFRYDEAGQPQAVSFMDYLMPTASEVPDIELIVSEEVPASTNALGVRGAGEGGLTGAGAALASGVRHALGCDAMHRLPMSPTDVLDTLANRRV